MPTDTRAPVGYPIAWCAVDKRERTDLATWLLLAGIGLLITWLAVRGGARLGTASAPFLGSYRFAISPLSLLAPAVAAGALLATWRGRLEAIPWWMLQIACAAGLFAWSIALALVDGSAGITRSLTPDNY